MATMSDQAPTVVVAYGDANALRRGVAHAVLRDVLLHGPLDPGMPIEDDPSAWVEAFATMRGAWLAGMFGVPAEAAAAHVSTPLRAVLNSAGLRVELVVDETPCVDCALARQLVRHVAAAAGAELLDAPEPRTWEQLEAWRASQLAELPRWVDEALAEAAAAEGGGTVLDAWRRLAELAEGTGLSDLAACTLFAQRLAEPDAPARLHGDHAPDGLVPACATNALHTIPLQPA